jgi:hypothetical protein
MRLKLFSAGYLKNMIFRLSDAPVSIFSVFTDLLGLGLLSNVHTKSVFRLHKEYYVHLVYECELTPYRLTWSHTSVTPSRNHTAASAITSSRANKFLQWTCRWTWEDNCACYVAITYYTKILACSYWFWDGNTARMRVETHVNLWFS